MKYVYKDAQTDFKAFKSTYKMKHGTGKQRNAPAATSDVGDEQTRESEFAPEQVS